MRRRNIRLEDPYDWELLRQTSSDGQEALHETSVGYYSDNQNKGVPVVSAKALHERPLQPKDVNQIGGHSQGHSQGHVRPVEQHKQSSSHVITKETPKDFSLVTQMNACAEELSTRPTTARDKRNVTQYCVS